VYATWFRGVSVAPGESALTVIPCGPSSTASVFVSPRIPPFAVTYAVSSAIGWMSTIEVTLTMERRSPARPCGAPLRGSRRSSVQVGGEQAVPVVVSQLEERLHHQPGRVVDPDVDPAPRLDGRCASSST